MVQFLSQIVFLSFLKNKKQTFGLMCFDLQKFEETTVTFTVHDGGFPFYDKSLWIIAGFLQVKFNEHNKSLSLN